MTKSAATACAPSSVIYALGVLGAWVWFWQQSEGFWEHAWAIVEGFLWPAYMVYQAFAALA